MPSSRDEYSAAEVELQRLRDLKPGVPSLTRASYSFELHGRQADAVAVLQRAASIAAASQYAIVRAEEKLFAAGGNSDLEVALLTPITAGPLRRSAAAKSEWDRRKSIQVEDG